MSIWNQIVTAVYRDDWALVERAVHELAGVDLDNTHVMAEVLGHIVAEQLRRDDRSCLVETVTWLLRQPYLDRSHFAEWVMLDTLKHDSALHTRIFHQVAQHCRRPRMLEIADHITDCGQSPRSPIKPHHCQVQ